MRSLTTEYPERFRYYDILVSAFLAVLLISNVVAPKLVDLGRVPVDTPVKVDARVRIIRPEHVADAVGNCPGVLIAVVAVVVV